MFGYRDKEDSGREPRQHRGGDDGPLHTEKIVTDRKIFFLDLKENDRGRFVKITEDVRGRRDTIMLPIENLDDFLDALHAIREADQETE
ncbi:MAG: DNA-binding protein [Verrucomicrobiota bacterium]